MRVEVVRRTNRAGYKAGALKEVSFLTPKGRCAVMCTSSPGHFRSSCRLRFLGHCIMIDLFARVAYAMWVWRVL